MRALSLAVLCLAAAGCRVDPNIVLLERENRQLEDRIYQLEDALAKAQGGVAVVGSPAAFGPPSVVRPPEAASQAAPGPTTDGPTMQPPREPDVGRLQSPKIVMPPDEADAPGNRKGSPAPRGADFRKSSLRRLVPSAMGTARLASTAPPAETTRDSNRIQQITLNPSLTGGYNMDGRPGHEGIATLVELRDAKGRLLNAAAPISVAVVDKAIPGSASRVARWDYSAQEVATQWRKTPMGEGVLIQTLWPGDPPVHSQLRLYVRLTTDDGRKLDAIRDIEIQVPQRSTAGWMPATPKELPPEDSPAVPLAQRKSSAQPPGWTPSPPRPLPPVAQSQPAKPPRPAAEPAAEPASEPMPEPVEAAAAPILELPEDAASEPEPAPRDPPRQVAVKRPPAPETAIQRPVWSPYRR